MMKLVGSLVSEKLACGAWRPCWSCYLQPDNLEFSEVEFQHYRPPHPRLNGVVWTEMMLCGDFSGALLRHRRAGAAGVPCKAASMRPPALCSRQVMPAARRTTQPVVAAAATSSPSSQDPDRPRYQPARQRSRPSTGRGGGSSARQAPLPGPSTTTTPSATTPTTTATSVESLCGLLVELNKCSRAAKDHKQTNRATAASLTTLCSAAAAGLQQYGHDLPADEFAFLGTSLWQTSIAMGRQWPPLAQLAQASTSAAKQAPALTTASVGTWSQLLYGLAKAGVRSAGLYDLMAQAQRRISVDAWVACATQPDAPRRLSNLLWAYATVGYKGEKDALTSGVSSALTAGAFAKVESADFSSSVWALGNLGCRLDQPQTLASVQVVLDVVKQGGMQRAKPQAWANLLWGLAKMGCRAGPNSKCDMTPLVASAVGYVQQGGMQQAASQAWSNLLWALATLQVPMATAQPVLDVGLPAFKHMAHMGACNVEHVTMTAFALNHYGLAVEIQALLAGLPAEQLERYQTHVRNPKLKYVGGKV